VKAVKFEDQPTVKFRVDKKTKFAYVSDAIRVLQQIGRASCRERG